MQPPGLRTRRLSRPLVLAAALGLLTAAVYAPVRHHAFLHFDDPEYVTANRHVTAGLTAAGFVWAWTGIHQASWHPLTSLSHMLDCQLFGLRPGPPHLVNATLHVLNTVLLFGVLLRMTGRPFPSAFVAALFGVHPLHVESVAWVSERKDVLSTFFWLLTLWAYTAYVRRRSAARYGLVLATYVAALLSKPMVVTLPGVLLLLDVWPLRRLGGASAEGATSTRASRHRKRAPARGRVVLERGAARTIGQVPAVRPGAAVIEKLPLLVLAAIVSVITVIAQRHGGAVASLAKFPVADRAANALVAYAAYVREMFWPSGLAIYYPFEAPLPLWQVLGAAVLLGATTAGVLWDWRRHGYLLTGWLWYLGTLLPVIGLVQVGEQAMADRYTYIPSIGIFIIAAWGLPDLLRQWRLRQVGCAVAAVLAIAACTVLTVRQLALWGDEVQLFQHTLAVTRNNWVAHNNLGVALLERGTTQDAVTQHMQALELAPGDAGAHNALGSALAAQGKTQAAITQYRQAMELRPGYADAHYDLANALAAQGELDDAITQYRQAVELKPDDADMHNNLGAALALQGKQEQAIVQYGQALQLNSELPEAHNNLADALAAQGKTVEAIKEYEKALQIRQEYPEVHTDLGRLLVEQGQVAAAIAHYEAALRLKPEYAAAHRYLGMALARQGDMSGAVAQLQAAVRLNPSDAEARRELEQLEHAPKGPPE